ncbi:MAG: CobD/CbiB family cobalamin biosynthesis protein [Halorientalis sp.]
MTGAVPSAGAVGLAFVLDAAAGEPPTAIHPVAWFGRVVGPLDRDWPAPRLVGLLGAFALPLAAAALVWAAVAAATTLDPLAGAAVAGLALFLATSLRRLLSTARAVSETTERHLAAAREDLRALAGRDAAALSAGQVRSAAVESAAENLADGLVAPLLAFAVGAQLSLAVGAAAAAWVKAVNTMDSMLGYRSKPVGWGPARLDDAVMWFPARASALLLAAAAGAPTALRSASRWVDAVPSPNSGWPMGTLAAGLDVRLEKPGAYVLNPGATLPTVADARAAVRTVAVAGVLAYALAAAVVVLPEVR